jgi:hypothetical protein
VDGVDTEQTSAGAYKSSNGPVQASASSGWEQRVPGACVPLVAKHGGLQLFHSVAINFTVKDAPVSLYGSARPLARVPRVA